MNVCVFCSANRLPARYTAPAERFGELLGQRGHTLVWGGSNSGLMETVAAAAERSGAALMGISVEFLRHVVRPGVKEMVICADLSQRKALMLERADVVVTLVGGTGTLDEVTEIIELKKHGRHDKPVIILNTDGFYDGLRLQLEKMQSEGFLPRPLGELIDFADGPDEAIAKVEASLTGGSVPGGSTLQGAAPAGSLS